ncbi:MAG: hypothetical protein Q7S06_03870 [Nanoarchaeota archaeon]|nr:hypothetical protein [Nanoarchaeota archaeon]
MNLDKWNDFLSRWARAVSSYETPADFVYGARVLSQKWEFDGKPLEVRVIVSPNNALRRELMAKQKTYVFQKQQSEYIFRLDEKCFLCQNVVQAIDSIGNSLVPNNIISIEGSCMILPNRYPAFIGHSLFVPTNHDDTSHRITPMTVTFGDDKKRQVYMPEQGKTAGDLMNSDYLANLIDVCNKYSLVALNNHVRDGMSIPGHKHFHLYPEDLELFSRAPTRFSPTEFGAGMNVDDTLFSTLAFSMHSYDQIDRAAETLQRMEQANEVFTLAYVNKVLFVSPRKNIPVGERIQIGAGVPVHFFGSEEGMKKTVSRYVPVKSDNYNWERFIK